MVEVDRVQYWLQRYSQMLYQRKENMFRHFGTNNVSKIASKLGFHRTTLYAWFRKGEIGGYSRYLLIDEGWPVERWEK